jgi:hypothetical protein
MKYALGFAAALALTAPSFAGSLLPAEETQAPVIEEAVGGSLSPVVIGVIALALLAAAADSSSSSSTGASDG